ncbi:MAG: glycine cleavage system protein GcvH [Promethearchaeota archaeon]|nr:MAG: glycine cleavage system protein GcvH [Candidatus Lokiarchaeota archaeon]
MDYEFPDHLKYTSTHEWIRFENNIATVGITDYAQHQLGDIVFVELPEVGMVFEKGSNAAEIESVKAVGDLIMPLSGEIIEINENLADNPELVNSSPFGEGWMIRIKYSHLDEKDDLLSSEEYKQILQKEIH